MKARSISILLLGFVASGCVVQTEPGPKGDPGPPGDAGPPGQPDSAALSELQASIKNLQSQIDAMKVQSATPNCPSGYTMALKPFLPSTPDSVLCTSGDDEIVRVGSGAAAFWIDRFEVSIWDGTMQRFADSDDSNVGATFPKSGQTSTPWLARSVSGVLPAGNVTWFQAQAACRAAGKRLPTDEEWLAAARKTSDPGENNGLQNTKCNTSAAMKRKTGNAGDPSKSGQGSGCFSDWGAEDMAGNVKELVKGSYAIMTQSAIGKWPEQDYGSDKTVGFDAAACMAGATGCDTLLSTPMSLKLGGDFTDGIGAGVFAIQVDSAPSSWHANVGFRCIVPRCG